MGDVRLPYWPRGLSEPLAAAYVGLSESTFRAQVIPEVKPVALTKGRQVWLREDLDAWLDRKAGRGQPSDSGSEWMAALDGTR